jgi:NOL1/NOP2/sun family putative RNA methylase
MDLPPRFVEQMQRLLAGEAPDFLACYPGAARQGLRANTLKIEPAALMRRLPYPLEPLPWAPEGFLIGETSGDILPPSALPPDAPPPGKHPDHAAGLYYLQEPAAMAVAHALDPQPGERVLDLSAAPGGKSTHLAALLGGSGWLLANEIHPGRVWELAENLERCGARNASITQETPQRLAERLERVFDRILVDAPCTGEGMFRKSAAARRDWSPEAVHSSALRQAAILDDAVRMLRPGGRLVYSTCTFNPTENEAVIAGLLERRPDLALISAQTQPGFSPGRPDWLTETDATEHPRAGELAHAVRLWPHQTVSEGHFIAILQHITGKTPAPGAAQGWPSRASRKARPSKRIEAGLQAQAAAAFQDFVREHLHADPLDDLDARLVLAGTRLYAVPTQAADLSGLKVIHPGWQLGELPADRRGDLRFEPAHALALGLFAEQAMRRVDYPADAPELRAYLRGETLPSEGESGWVLVSIDGYGLGWGKRVNGVLKNSYPRGLRRG